MIDGFFVGGEKDKRFIENITVDVNIRDFINVRFSS